MSGLEEKVTMFIAMNRFKVLKDCTQDFENVWFSRESYLHELPGFVAFHLLKGPEREDHVLYASHTLWRSHADFENWTRSEAFRKAHARAGGSKPTTLGHPEFEGFHVIQEVTADGAVRRVAAE
jgi:heme-degrading monooxygenase HmoA